jgi:hypothetical protein
MAGTFDEQQTDLGKLREGARAASAELLLIGRGCPHLTVLHKNGTPLVAHRDSTGPRPSRLSDDEVEADFSPRQRAEELLTLMSACTCQARTNGAPPTDPAPPSWGAPLAPMPGDLRRRAGRRSGARISNPGPMAFQLTKIPLPAVVCGKVERGPPTAKEHTCNWDRSCIGKLVAKSPATRAETPLSPRRSCIVMHCAIHSRRRNHCPRRRIATHFFERV